MSWKCPILAHCVSAAVIEGDFHSQTVEDRAYGAFAVLGLESYRGWGRAGWIRMMPSSNGIRSMQWRRRRTGGFLDVPSLITLKHPTLFIFSMLKAPKREKTGEGNRGSKNLPGMIATVLRARKTRKVRSAARLPRSIPIVMYLQSTKVHKLEWNSSSKNQFSFRMQKTTS